TFFAVTWGTLAVVLLLAFGEGLKRTVRDGLLGAGERMFMVYGGETSKAFAGLGEGRRIRLVEGDLDLLRNGVPDVDRGSVVDGLPFTVVGVLKKKFQDSSNNGPDADRGVIPYSTFRTIYGNRFVSHLIVQPRDASRGPVVKAELYRVLGRKYSFDPTDQRALGMWDFIEDEKETTAVGLGIQIFMGLVGAFTLLIAGVGVANIMYV